MNFIEILQEFVRIDTTIVPSANQFPPSSATEFLDDVAGRCGFQKLDLGKVFYPGTDHEIFPALYIKKGKEDGKRVLFLGHLDVVPVSERELGSWKHPPFSGEIEGGKLYGRGSSDMKSGVISFFNAFEGEVARGVVIIAVSADEEVGGNGSVPVMINLLSRENLLPDYVINAEPSGRNIIVTRRRGGTWIRYRFPKGTEKTTGRVVTREFESMLGDGSESLHSSAFVPGADIHAMIAAAKFCVDRKIVDVKSSSNKENAVPQVVTVTYIEENGDEELEYDPVLSKVMAGIASVYSIHFPVAPSKYGTSVCPNLIETGEETVLTFDIRAMLQSTGSHEKMARLISTHFHEVGASNSYELTSCIDPVNVSPEGFLPEVVREVAESHGIRIIDVGEKLGGASDTRFFTSKGIPGVELGPIGGNGHGTNEYVTVDSFLKLSEIFRDVYVRIQGS